MLAGGVMVYSYAELEAGTKQFDATSLVGVGGFGRVFQGFVRQTTVAVKLLSEVLYLNVHASKRPCMTS